MAVPTGNKFARRRLERRSFFAPAAVVVVDVAGGLVVVVAGGSAVVVAGGFTAVVAG